MPDNEGFLPEPGLPALLQTATETTFLVYSKEKIGICSSVCERWKRDKRIHFLSLVPVYMHILRHICPTAIKISAEGRRFLRMCEVTVLGTSPASPPAGPCCMRTSWLIVLHTLKLGALKRRGCSFCPSAAEWVPQWKRKWEFSSILTFPFPTAFLILLLSLLPLSSMYSPINDFKKTTNPSWCTQKCKAAAEQTPFASGSVAASACEAASQDCRWFKRLSYWQFS